jgi:hypothetical protein
VLNCGSADRKWSSEYSASNYLSEYNSGQNFPDWNSK